MKRKKRRIIKWSIGLLLLVITLTFFKPSRIISYYGWIEIADKTVAEDKYYITTDLGEGMIEIEMEETEKFLYEETPQDNREVVITDVWDSIDKNEQHFVKVEYSGIICPSYKIEKMYGY